MSRVTQSMLSTQLLRNLNTNMSRMEHQLNQLSTTKKINKPSDDPVGITYSLRYRSELAANEQYQRNIDSTLSYIDFTDTLMDQAGEIMHRANTLAVRASNGTNPPSAMEAIAIELRELKQQLVDIGNSKLNGKYVFNGQKTDIPPYNEATAATDVTDPHYIYFEVGAGIQIPTNISGNEVFGPAGGDNAFAILDDLITMVENNDHAAVSGTLGRIDARQEAFLGARSEIGAKRNRTELVEGRLKDIGINIVALQSKTEDVDMAELITQLTISESVYQSSLSAGARIVKPSLLDFLR